MFRMFLSVLSLLQGVIFRRRSHSKLSSLFDSLGQGIHPPTERAAADLLDDRLELAFVKPNSTALLTAIERIALERVSL
jgi:hypothetical protein